MVNAAPITRPVVNWIDFKPLIDQYRKEENTWFKKEAKGIGKFKFMGHMFWIHRAPLDPGNSYVTISEKTSGGNALKNMYYPEEKVLDVFLKYMRDLNMTEAKLTEAVEKAIEQRKSYVWDQRGIPTYIPYTAPTTPNLVWLSLSPLYW